MKQSEMILELAIQNKGIVTASMVKEKNLSAGVLKYLCDNGKLEKTTRGVYMLPASWDDEFINLQGRFKKGIFLKLFITKVINRGSVDKTTQTQDEKGLDKKNKNVLL
ncbi:MAG: type IV toxin-antitoxin system AbiEi family antitoxin domain-containing protein [Acetivibrio sp.]